MLCVSLNKASDEECIQKCDVLCWAEGTRDAMQDEQASNAVQTKMPGNAREVQRETGAGAYCLPENGQKVSNDGTRD